MSDDEISVAPEVYSVVFENERVRVFSVRADPGSGSPIHRNPDSVMYTVSDAHIVATLPHDRHDH